MMKEDTDELRIRVWDVYHDIEMLEDMGFAPIGYPPMNPEDHSDDYSGLSAVDSYNSAIVLMRFGPRDSVLTARPCQNDMELKIKDKTYKMERAIMHTDEPDKSIEQWIDENVGGL